jgi:hypothetical protein
MPISHREGLAVDRELKPLCVGRWAVARRPDGSSFKTENRWFEPNVPKNVLHT